MPIWIVFVKVQWNDAIVMRYIDSQWASEKAATDRRIELMSSIRGFGCEITQVKSNGGMAYIVRASVTDAKLTETTEEQK